VVAVGVVGRVVVVVVAVVVQQPVQALSYVAQTLPSQIRQVQLLHCYVWAFVMGRRRYDGSAALIFGWSRLGYRPSQRLCVCATAVQQRANWRLSSARN